MRIRSLLVLLVALACASHPPDADPIVSYRLVTKEDFWASSSNSTWGNFAHGAEICMRVQRRPDYLTSLGFEVVMVRGCSFWNKTAGPFWTIVRMLGAIFGVPTISYKTQPGWYVLQHEQVHFSITLLEVLRLNRDIQALAATSDGDDQDWQLDHDIIKLRDSALLRAKERNGRFDSNTSGTYDPKSLEAWVRRMERHLKKLCPEVRACPVRQR